MMRQLLMGGSGGERTLVSTTDPHTSATSMPAMAMRGGASYSVSWTGTLPSVGSYSTAYVFELLGGVGSTVSSMCSAALRGGSGFGAHPTLSVTLFGPTVYSGQLSPGASVALELRFTVNAVSDTSPYYTLTAECYVDGVRKGGVRIKSTKNAGSGLRYYRNLAGTFIVKKLS